MIQTYPSGEKLVTENRAFLDTHPQLSTFFILDAPLLKETDKANYAVKCEKDGKMLLGLKVEPYNLLLYGNAECAEELLDFLMREGYEIKSYLCEKTLGDAVARKMAECRNGRYEEALAMDYMEAKDVTEPSSPEVEAADEGDLDEIEACMKRFLIECDLRDEVNREALRKGIGEFRVIRKAGRIVSVAKAMRGPDGTARIGDVYTPEAYRGKGYARKVVNAIKNEILAAGKIATLNVDRRNPVTNHLYRALGFSAIFSQSEYRRIERDG